MLLSDAVLSSQERHALVSQRARAISTFVRGPNWSRARSQLVINNTIRFKDILSPFFNAGFDRADAGRDLAILCDKCLHVSVLLNSTDLSFQFVFNECGIKITEQSHRALNSRLAMRELQARHYRLMCGITPGITYLNDAGMSVDPRFISKANVLVMQ